MASVARLSPGTRIKANAYSKGAVETRASARKPSKTFREKFRHTPVSIEEEIPWQCRRLIIGTAGTGDLPVMDNVSARPNDARSHCSSSQPPTPLKTHPHETNAILHVTW